VISLKKVALGNKIKKNSCKKNFWSEVYKKCQYLLFCFQLQLLQFLSLNRYGFDPGLEAGSR
jgi:hypothetical protein